MNRVPRCLYKWATKIGFIQDQSHLRLYASRILPLNPLIKMMSYEPAFRLRRIILQIFREALKGIFFVYSFIISTDLNERNENSNGGGLIKVSAVSLLVSQSIPFYISKWSFTLSNGCEIIGILNNALSLKSSIFLSYLVVQKECSECSSLLLQMPNAQFNAIEDYWSFIIYFSLADKWIPYQIVQLIWYFRSLFLAGASNTHQSKEKVYHITCWWQILWKIAPFY